jgi:tetratricopeptide (TPR) repeat protein
VHPDDQQASALDDLAVDGAPQTVVWLDELQRYIDGPCGLSAGKIRALLRSRTLVVATMWSDEYAARTVRQRRPEGMPADVTDRNLLDLATVIEVPDSLSGHERERAVALSATDRRIRTALEASDSGVIQVLAAGPALLRWWTQAPTMYAQAIITAAVDIRRIGVDLPVSRELLRDAVTGYLSSSEQARAPKDWMETALAYATMEIEGAASALMPVSAGMGIVSGYRAADFLLQHAHRYRRTERLPDSALDAVLIHFPEQVGLYGLALSAQNRMQMQAAEQILWRLLAEDHSAAVPLSELLEQQGRIDDAIDVLAPVVPPFDPEIASLPVEQRMGELHLPWQLANLLVAGDRVDEALAILEPWAEAGNLTAKARVRDLLFRSGQVEKLREYAESRNDLLAEIRLYELLEKLGRVDEVLDIEHGNTNEAIELLQRFPDAGEREATIILAHLLAKQGRTDEAMSYVTTIDIKDPSVGMAALETRVDLFLKQDDADGAIQFLASIGNIEELRAAVEAGFPGAAERLARLEAQQPATITEDS